MIIICALCFTVGFATAIATIAILFKIDPSGMAVELWNLTNRREFHVE